MDVKDTSCAFTPIFKKVIMSWFNAPQTIICIWRESEHKQQTTVIVSQKTEKTYTVFVLPNLYFIEDDLRY